MNTHDFITNKMLDRVRQLVGLYESQSEFGRITGLTRQTVSFILTKNIKNLSFTTIYHIVSGTGCNADWLVLGKGAPFSQKGSKSQEDTTKEEVIIALNDLVSSIQEDEPVDLKEIVETISLVTRYATK